MTVQIQPEQESDYAAVHRLNCRAFEATAEADLVDQLRRLADPALSLVAAVGTDIIGHIMFSPVTLSGHPELHLMGLGPMAVSPEHQNKGTGTELVNSGIDQCRDSGAGAIVVLGHPTYYPRFGFVPASNYGIDCEYDVPRDVFMIMELEPGYLVGKSGTVHYHDAFAKV